MGVTGRVRFDRSVFGGEHLIMTIGEGRIGGKGAGLLSASQVLDVHGSGAAAGRILVDVPRTIVLTTDVFDAFMERGNLFEVGLSGRSDERIALAFQKAEFPAEFVGDLAALVSLTKDRPLAVRSSSLLEDSLTHPFAGVYDTKMVPNAGHDSSARFRALVEAVKFVYASTFSRAALAYIRGIGRDAREEKMAVIIQEVVGRAYGERYYPEVSGVFRTYSYYRTGSARPDQGVITLALGLGKTVVDGAACWSYSPARPMVGPPYGSVQDLLRRSQSTFWAVNLGPPPAYDPSSETEYLVRGDLAVAERDGSLRHVASTYDAQNERLTPGMHKRGPRVLDFSPLVRFEEWPLTAVCRHLLDAFRSEMGHAVEVEFAMKLPRESSEQARMAILQVRPMALHQEQIDLASPTRLETDVLAYSDFVMGNGAYDTLTDVVYVPPDRFDASLTRRMATELEQVNNSLLGENRRYLLLGFGRWGSSDPWLGIPVTWGQISAASVIVESTLPKMDVDPSQGAHFLLNLEAFRVAYFTVPHSFRPPVDWDWLDACPAIREGDLVRHIRLPTPLNVRVDGRTGRGVIRKGLSEEPV